MFYDKFIRLCVENGEKPSVVAQKIGLNKSASTAWKRGSEPTDATKALVAEFFSVPVSYFDETENIPADFGEDDMELLDRIHARPELKILMHNGDKAPKELVDKINALFDELQKQ